MNKMVSMTVTDNMKRQMNVNLIIVPSTEYFFKALAKGNLPLGEMFDAIRKDMNSDISNDQLLMEARSNIKSFATVGILFARHKSIPAFNDFPDRA